MLSTSNLEEKYRPHEAFAVQTWLSVGLAVVSGFLLYASHDLELDSAKLLGFLALVPLLAAIEGKRPLSAFFLAFIAFYIHLFLTIFWISRYGYLVLAGLIVMEATVYSMAFALYNFLKERNHGRDSYLLMLPMLISIVEFKRAIGPWAFPWAYMAHSQSQNLIFIQSSSLWGIFGIGFLLVWVNVYVYRLFRAFPNHPRHLLAGVPLLIILLFNQVWGYNRLDDDSFLSAPVFPTTVAQRAAGTDVAWTSDYNYRSWVEYENLTRKEIDPTQGKPGFVVWPENAVPDLLQFRLPGLTHLSDVSGKTFIIGTLTWAPEDADYDDDYYEPWFKLFNSVVAVAPDDGVTGVYSKVHPVPFGETIPMREYLSILDYPWGDKNLSEGRTINSIPTPYGNAGTVVCYESCFPQITRKLILDGAKYLFLVSNTSWFGKSNATYQHARYDTFRSIENGCYFVRAATTGVSSVIDPRGRVLKETQPFIAESFTVDIHPLMNMTLYTIIGDWISYISMTWLILKLMVIFRPRTAKPLAESIALIEE